MADLKVTTREELTLNGYDQGATNTLTISGINELSKRIVTATTTEAGLLGFLSALSNVGVTANKVGYLAGILDDGDVRYMRITNLDASNHITLTFRDEDNTEYRMKRYRSEPVYRLKDIRKRQLLQFIKRVGGTKTRRTEALLGYTTEELKVHLESLFKDGMTWENQGKWHIDHRIPQSYFTSIDQIKECFALENLKPEWGEWNMSKGNRFIG